ncbi:TonB C-terminal domain-containing protein [Altericroceibacterium xinjiangense]|uniref:TonB C-terminal domain-containing protein n=1 Tax=Altericroceibacterium xinjiangense TaxID=762261 RepID=UPI000F7E20AE|nr:TonB C-terminal domain-containing protein [Altericroceibacterium xinjiangense]
MAALANLRREERYGLAIAVAAHVGLAGVLLLQPSTPEPPVPQQERMTVSLADEVSLTSTAPDPVAEPPAAVAPILAPEPAPPAPAPVAQPEPAPVPEVSPPTPRAPPPPPPPRPRASPRPAPRPSPTAAPRPQPTAKPSAAPRAAAPARQTPARSQAQPAPKPTTGGGSRIGDDFLAGVGASERAEAQGTPASEIGPSERASLGQAISRQLKPHWAPPDGVDVEKLVTVVRFRLNRDGSLSGAPQIVRTTGVTDSNRAQKDRYEEQAVRAVRLAAPFNLPEQYYDGWKVVNSNFDYRLSQ